MSDTKLSYKQLEQNVKRAIKDKKVFVIYYGYEPLKLALLRRGWLQKVQTEKISYMNGSTDEYIIANLLQYSQFNFIWQPKSRPIKIPNLNPPPMVNSIYRIMDYCSKETLVNFATNASWYTIEGISQLNLPRTYVLSDRKGKTDIIQDFKRTKFTSFVLFLAKQVKKNDFKSLFTDGSEGVPCDAINFALSKVDTLIKIKNHDDIDSNYINETFSRLLHGQDKKEMNIQRIMNGTKKFKMQTDEKIYEIQKLIQNCATQILHHWPERRFDGFKNIWIAKPVGYSSGYGVTLSTDLDEIIRSSQTSHTRIIVQKYIERPMVVHGRKLDIRIYFVTQIRNGFVNIWIYKNCYFRFGSQKFNLDHLDRSIHVTNHAVQKHYMRTSSAVPNSIENMWPLSEFLRYLNSVDLPNLWDEKIYPQIKQTIVALILQSIETTVIEENNFELNGADFLITKDHEVLLLEVNSKPALFFTESVIPLITEALLEDIVKILVDYQDDKTASTGDFELAHVIEIPKIPSDSDMSLTVQGKKILRSSRRSTATSKIIQQKIPEEHEAIENIQYNNDKIAVE